MKKHRGELGELQRLHDKALGFSKAAKLALEKLDQALALVDFEALASEVEAEAVSRAALLEKQHGKQLSDLEKRLDRSEKALSVLRHSTIEQVSNAHADHAERFEGDTKTTGVTASFDKKERLSIRSRILIALYQEPSGSLTRAQVGFVAGISTGSGSVIKAYAELSEEGYIEGRGTLSITEKGRLLLSNTELLPRPPTYDLLKQLYKREEGQLGVVLRALISLQKERFGDGYTRDAICEKASTLEGRHVSARSGSSIAAFSRLMKLELVEGRGLVSMQKWLASMVLPITVRVHDRSTGETRKVEVK